MTEYILGTDGDEGHWLTGETIVRCRDCGEDEVLVGGELRKLKHHKYCILQDRIVPDDGFCKWGERK